MSHATDAIVGIDLGTTNSLVAVCDERGPRVLLDDDVDASAGDGGRADGAAPSTPNGSSVAAGRSALIPSVVLYRADGPPIVGRSARDARLGQPREAIWSVKRLMGRSLRDVQRDPPGLPYEVVEGPRGMACVAPLGAPITPQEVSAEILRRLRRRAERALGRPVNRAVVTVPAYFDDAQRQATRDAGRLAGLDVLRIVNEPTAAALAYGIGLRSNTDAGAETTAAGHVAARGATGPQIVAVYDLGGGTFDVSILRLTSGPAPGAGADHVEDRKGTLAGRTAAADVGEHFFQVLSTAGDTRLGGDDLDALLADELERRLEAENGGARDGTRPAADREALRAAAEAAKIALSAEERTLVRIEGGSSAGVARTVEVDRVTVEALAEPLIERTLACCRRVLADAGLAASDIDRVVLVGGMTRMPLVRRAVAEHFGQRPYTALDPDQVVALGAAVQASIIAGIDRATLLLDVIPLSLGIETVGGAVAKLIVRNTSVPARAREMFSTSVDGQTSVKVHVLQGERELVADCRSLGEFHLRGIPPMPAGIPQVEVEFLVDANGILDVTALERRSGRRAAIQVIPAHGLTREEVDRMEREGYAHARADMHAHRVVDLVVNAQLDVKWIREALDRVRDELLPAYAADIDARLSAMERMVADARIDPASADAEALHRAKQELDVASARVHEVSIARSLRAGGV